MPHKDPEKKAAYHREYGTQWAKRQYHQRVRAGVCHECRSPVLKYRLCVECRLKKREDYHQRLKPKLAIGAKPCVDCGKLCLRATSTRCQFCQGRRASQIQHARHPAKAVTCIDCGVRIGRRSTRCKSCHGRRVMLAIWAQMQQLNGAA